MVMYTHVARVLSSLDFLPVDVCRNSAHLLVLGGYRTKLIFMLVHEHHFHLGHAINSRFFLHFAEIHYLDSCHMVIKK